MTDAPDASAVLQLSGDEALVLFELLSRWTDHSAPGAGPSPDCFESPAEIAALIGLLASLQRQLNPPFSADYLILLSDARNRLTQQNGADVTL